MLTERNSRSFSVMEAVKVVLIVECHYVECDNVPSSRAIPLPTTNQQHHYDFKNPNTYYFRINLWPKMNKLKNFYIFAFFLTSLSRKQEVNYFLLMVPKYRNWYSWDNLVICGDFSVRIYPKKCVKWDFRFSIKSP